MSKKIDQEVESANKILNINILKALIYTFFTVIFSFYGINFILSLIFRNVSENQLDAILILSLIIGGIFSMYMCTLVILNEMKKH